MTILIQQVLLTAFLLFVSSTGWTDQKIQTQTPNDEQQIRSLMGQHHPHVQHK